LCQDNFFKLQNYHKNKEKSFEPLALTPYCVTENIISLIVHAVGASSKQAASLKKGDMVSLMGPCGQQSYVPNNSTVLLIGEGIGNLSLLPYAKKLKNNGNKIIFLALYKKKTHLFYPDKIKFYADEVIFVCNREKIDTETGISIKGSVAQALSLVNFSNIKNIFVMGSASMLDIVSSFILKNNTDCLSQASISAPMQCMMGGVCGQCIIQTADGSFVFICKNQDQKLNLPIVQNLNIRLAQNSLLEKCNLITTN